MIKVESIAQLVGLISEIRNLRRGFVTNFYLDEFKHGIWIEHEDLFCEKSGDSLIILRKDTDFWNVFYCSTSYTELGNSIRKLKDNNQGMQMMIDVVGNDSQVADAMNMFENIGFSKYCSLVRMSRMTPKDSVVEVKEHVSFASVSEASLVLSLLREHFNSKCEQIPYLDELEEYARNGRILVYKEDAEMLGFVVFEMNKSTLYLRYWFVHPNYRDKKIGSILLNSFFAEGKDTKRQLFWVITDNDNAIKRYKHYGFVEENMFDFVLTNK